jgi:hypothetical protein
MSNEKIKQNKYKTKKYLHFKVRRRRSAATASSQKKQF